MEDIEIINLWKSNDKKINESILLNRKNAEEITKMKAQSLLSSMKPIKLFTVLVGILWVGLGMIVLSNIYFYAFGKANKFFLFSATIQVGLTAIALFIYLYQLILIYGVDLSKAILATQEKLTNLKSSTLWVARILFLQLPVWTTFYWNESMLENGNWFLWIIQGIVTLSLTYVAVWLFFNIKYENRNKKWFRLIFTGDEWTPVINSMELLSQIEEYRIDGKT